MRRQNCRIKKEGLRRMRTEVLESSVLQSSLAARELDSVDWALPACVAHAQ